jgi:glutamyl-tRNA reductase
MNQPLANLWVVGLSHRTAPVEVRETLALDAHRLPSVCRNLREREEVEECLVLSTCNRSEALAVLKEGVRGGEFLRGFWASIAGAGKAPSIDHYFSLHGREGLRHLFRVASSLDSMVVGEPQILGQLKNAYATAKQAGSLDGILDMMLTRSFQVAKRVRTETGIGENAVSISFAAVELAKRIFGELRGKRVLILGAGKMSELAARHLRQSGAEHIFVTNRTYHRAVEIAAVFHGVSFPYEDLEKRLPEMDIVITSSAAPHYVITESLMRRVMEARRHKPTFLIDIAVPRNVEPSVHSLDQVFLYDIDDLQKVVEENLRERAARADRAEEIVQEEVDKAIARLRARQAVPTIVRLQEHLEQIRSSEVDRMRRKLGPLSPEQQEAIDHLTRSIVAKIAHGPIAEIRRYATQPEGIPVVDALRRAFSLEEVDPSHDPSAVGHRDAEESKKLESVDSVARDAQKVEH